MVWSVGGGELLRSNKPQGQRDPLQVTSQEFPPHVDLTHGEIFFFFFFLPLRYQTQLDYPSPQLI